MVIIANKLQNVNISMTIIIMGVSRKSIRVLIYLKTSFRRKREIVGL